MKSKFHSLTRVLAVLVAIAALIGAAIAMLNYLNELMKRKKPYTEFPPEYDDYADWEMD